jgi:excisionase family DNA binding protein
MAAHVLAGDISSNYIEPPIDGKAAAQFLSIHQKTLQKYVRDGRIPAHRIGSKCWRFYKSELDNWLRLCDNGNQPIRSRELKEIE